MGTCRRIQQYETLEQVGEGTYGVVYRARDMRSNRIVALKKVRMEKEKDGIPITCLREVKILKEVDHPNIVRLLGVTVGRQLDAMYLAFEYVEHDLAGLIDNMKKPFTEAEVKCLMMQLLRAVHYLHRNYYIHRDLKLSNLLFSNKGELKLCDFGLARIFGEPNKAMTPKVVTLWYRAPELLMGCKDYTVAVDMWAVGCIFGELLMNTPVMPGKTEIEQLQLMCRLLGTPNDKIWPGYYELPNAKIIAGLPQQNYHMISNKFKFLSPAGQDLIKKFLTYDPNKRITAYQALQHPYFTESPMPKSPDMMPTFPTKLNTGYRRARRSDEVQEDRRMDEERRHQNDRFGEVFGDHDYAGGAPLKKRRF